jgi:hypothetical protein
VTGTENSPTGTLEEHLRLGAGFAAADRPHILEALSALAPHLSGWEHDQVDLEVSLKDAEGPDQKVTLQAWLVGRVVGAAPVAILIMPSRRCVET